VTDPVREACALLLCATPQAWLDVAASAPAELLIDHANCEKKAASLAVTLLFRYPDDTALAERMSRLAREELRHFEQVLAALRERGVHYRALSASRYAGALRAQCRTHEPDRLVDTLLVSAIVEARSCERFARLAAVLPQPLARFYARLLDAEARHHALFLELAAARSVESIAGRLERLLAVEADLITRPDRELRFHSGPPAAGRHLDATSAQIADRSERSV
jgi:tRNA-(ms[2]io[6]A)-hydroxylase